MNEIEELKEKIKILEAELKTFEVVAYARTNERGDIFALNVQNNPYVNQETVVPLYRKK